MGGAARSTLVRHIGTLLTGDAAAPRSPATTLYVEHGVVAGVGEAWQSADTVVDAGGGLVLPGLWDADHHLYFGDYTPTQEAHGYLARTVRAGTTSIVSSGLADLPGQPWDPRGVRHLAILAGRSWVFDRPLGLKAHAGTALAVAGLGEADVAEMARAGICRLAFQSASGALPAATEAERQATWARAQGMVVMADAGLGDALRSIRPDVVLRLNGGAASRPAAEETVAWLVRETRAALGVSLAGSLRAAVRLLERAGPERIVVGTDTPSTAGVAPGGVQRMIQHLASLGGLEPGLATALGSGNVARAYGLEGGRLAVGQPADLLVCSGDPGALTRGEWLSIRTILIDGQPVPMTHDP